MSCIFYLLLLSYSQTSEVEMLNERARIFTPTMHLRIAVPEGTHTPDQQKLQQLWEEILPHETDGTGKVTEWRDVPKVVVPKAKEHDYSDCDPAVFKGKIAHLKYIKLIDQEKLDSEPKKPFVLYITKNDLRGYSFEDGVKVERTGEFQSISLRNNYE